MSYKGICPTCRGNGYVNIKNEQNEKNTHQCWTCASQGEIKWSQAKVDEFIYNTYYRKRLQ